MSDSPKIKLMVAELTAAGWKQARHEGPYRWRDPHGNLHVGLSVAYRALKALQACALVAESALRELNEISEAELRRRDREADSRWSAATKAKG